MHASLFLPTLPFFFFAAFGLAQPNERSVEADYGLPNVTPRDGATLWDQNLGTVFAPERDPGFGLQVRLPPRNSSFGSWQFEAQPPARAAFGERPEIKRSAMISRFGGTTLDLVPTRGTAGGPVDAKRATWINTRGTTVGQQSPGSEIGAIDWLDTIAAVEPVAVAGQENRLGRVDTFGLPPSSRVGRGGSLNPPVAATPTPLPDDSYVTREGGIILPPGAIRFAIPPPSGSHLLVDGGTRNPDGQVFDNALEVSVYDPEFGLIAPNKTLSPQDALELHIAKGISRERLGELGYEIAGGNALYDLDAYQAVQGVFPGADKSQIFIDPTSLANVRLEDIPRAFRRGISADEVEIVDGSIVRSIYGRTYTIYDPDIGFISANPYVSNVFAAELNAESGLTTAQLEGMGYTVMQDGGLYTGEGSYNLFNSLPENQAAPESTFFLPIGFNPQSPDEPDDPEELALNALRTAELFDEEDRTYDGWRGRTYHLKQAYDHLESVDSDFARGYRALYEAVYEEVTNYLPGGNDIESRFSYEISDLRTSSFGAEEWRTLSAYLNEGAIELGDSYQYIDALQNYFGYDNESMVEALREIYYPDALDKFVAGAPEVGPEVHQLVANGPDANGVTHTQAALAEAVLFLTKQGFEYGDPVVKLVAPDNLDGLPPGEEFSFDHLIAGLDAASHDMWIPDGIVPNGGIVYFGGNPLKIDTDDAVTWLGDLAATVQQAHWGEPYNVEMPLQDFYGDILGLVAGQEFDAHTDSAYDPGGDSLETYLSTFFASDRFRDRYTLFAQAIDAEVAFDDDTARYYISNRSELTIPDMHPNNNIAALGIGLTILGAEPLSLRLPLLDVTVARELAVDSMNTFLDQIEAGLNGEEIPEP